MNIFFGEIRSDRVKTQTSPNLPNFLTILSSFLPKPCLKFRHHCWVADTNTSAELYNYVPVGAETNSSRSQNLIFQFFKWWGTTDAGWFWGSKHYTVISLYSRGGPNCIFVDALIWWVILGALIY